MSDVRHGIVLLTAGKDRAALIAAAGGSLIDETEGSATVAYDTESQAKKALAKVIKAGLVDGETVWQVAAPLPDWWNDYKEAADAMLEHGG
jgi:hypothetical protein